MKPAHPNDQFERPVLLEAVCIGKAQRHHITLEATGSQSYHLIFLLLFVLRHLVIGYGSMF